MITDKNGELLLPSGAETSFPSVQIRIILYKSVLAANGARCYRKTGGNG